MISKIVSFDKVAAIRLSILRHKQEKKWLRAIYRLVSLLIKKYLFFYLCRYEKNKLYPSPLQKDNNIVVSLTTFPKRINDLWMVLESIYNQTIRPSRIYLYLINEEFPNGKSDLPQRLLEYEKLGLEICFRNEKLMPHAKYYYALQEHPDNIVITIDDDAYYHPDMIENLLSTHKRYPKAVCSNIVDYMAKNPDGTYKKYLEWPDKIDSMYEESEDLLALGVGGVLYPPYIFKGYDEIFNIENIKKLSLRADDLWLKIHEKRAGIKVASGKVYPLGIVIPGSQTVSLMATNCNENQNDIQLAKMLDYYKM